jgi:hypothetical protein
VPVMLAVGARYWVVISATGALYDPVMFAVGARYGLVMSVTGARHDRVLVISAVGAL